MRDGDISELKDTLTALKKNEAAHSHFRQVRRFKAGASQSKPTKAPAERLSAFFGEEEKAFRSGVRTRLKAHDRLATPVTSATPLYTRLESPFWIWSFRDGVSETFDNQTLHREPLNSWARFSIWWDHQSGYIGPVDEVVFYFLWRNETGGDAVVNVESDVLLRGTCELAAQGGFIPELWPLFGDIGESTLTIAAHLTLREWWNQPPTQPLRQPNQGREVIDRTVRGAFLPFSWGAGLGGERRTFADNYRLNYDEFFVPTGAVAVFEVSLNMHYGGRRGSIAVDFLAPGSVLCPYVELKTLAVLPTG